MFKKKEEIDVTKIDTIIGKETVIAGNVEAKGVLRVDGKITGELTTNGDIIVSESGVIEAEVKARSISIAGIIKGNVSASGILEIESTGKLLGDIKVSKLSICDGAVFMGACEMVHASETKKKAEKPEKENAEKPKTQEG